MAPSRSSYFVQSLERGLAVIRAFGSDAPALSIAEVAQKIGVPRPAARRFLLTLVDLGYATQNGKAFQLRPKVLDLGFAYLSSLDIWELGQAYLEDLAKQVRETCSMAVLEGSEIVYVGRTFVERVIPSQIVVGTRLPAYATSMGRVLLAALPEDERRALLARSPLQRLTPRTVVDVEALMNLLSDIGKQGFALVDEELSLGLRSVAVPVFNRSRKVVAALNISANVWRATTEEMVRTQLPLLRAAAEDLSRKLP